MLGLTLLSMPLLLLIRKAAPARATARRADAREDAAAYAHAEA
jgi:hypothetical protein